LDILGATMVGEVEPDERSRRLDRGTPDSEQVRTYSSHDSPGTTEIDARYQAIQPE
jgi:hypothetical protein